MAMKRITTTIKKEYLRQILRGEKNIEYREIKPYWTKRLAGISVPFELRMINGMQPKAPEITVLIDSVHQQIDPDTYRPAYALHIARLVDMKNVLTVAMIREIKRQLMGCNAMPGRQRTDIPLVELLSTKNRTT